MIDEDVQQLVLQTPVLKGQPQVSEGRNTVRKGVKEGNRFSFIQTMTVGEKFENESWNTHKHADQDKKDQEEGT